MRSLFIPFLTFVTLAMLASSAPLSGSSDTTRAVKGATIPQPGGSVIDCSVSSTTLPCSTPDTRIRHSRQVDPEDVMKAVESAISMSKRGTGRNAYANSIGSRNIRKISHETGRLAHSGHNVANPGNELVSTAGGKFNMVFGKLHGMVEKFKSGGKRLGRIVRTKRGGGDIHEHIHEHDHEHVHKHEHEHGHEHIHGH